MRRLTTGMPCMLLAALLLFARLVAPSIAMPTDPVELLALQSICHTDIPGQPGEPTKPGHTDCLLCPACHLVSQAALPPPNAPLPPPPAIVAVGVSAPVPPATGPPRRARATAQPTGPPTLSA